MSPASENRLVIPAHSYRGGPSRFASRARLAATCVLLMSSVACGEALRLTMPSGYRLVGFTGGDGRPIEVVSPFEDGRQELTCPKGPEDLDAKDSVYTSLHNRLGCSSSPLGWIAERLAQGLESAGFDVLTHAERTTLDSEKEEDVITVEGRMDMLEVEVLPQMQAVFAEVDLQVELFVSARSGLRASRRFHVKSQDAGLVVGSKTHQRLFDETADRAVRDMTAAILSLLNRFPESGRAASPEESEP